MTSLKAPPLEDVHPDWPDHPEEAAPEAGQLDKESPVETIAALSTNHQALSAWGPIRSHPVTSQMTSQVNKEVFIAGALTCRRSLLLNNRRRDTDDVRASTNQRS